MFLSEPRFDGLPCVLETPAHGQGAPSAEEIELARKLRRRGQAKRRRAGGRTQRRTGSTGN